MVAAERLERQDELEGYKVRLATQQAECQIAKNDLKFYQDTEKNLQYERNVTSRLLDMVNEFLIPRLTGTESNIPEDFNPGGIMKENWDLERRVRENAEVKDSLIERLKEEKEETDRRLAEKRTEVWALKQELARYFRGEELDS